MERKRRRRGEERRGRGEKEKEGGATIQLDNVAVKVHMYGLTTSLHLQCGCYLLKVYQLLHNELERR
ncbi:hypothetical protein llap_7563 [Limosa lapponica baueri]|uniref:Uncharacterized protein n=1 Tax=Limosa lapponica baueri TaxID=1758121 RepID=A0A2I0U7U9_LIMLA|nr:hypothetical protein llap_7563 [Limosa lapponica baueri]